MVLIVEIPEEVYEQLVTLAAAYSLTVAEWVPVHLARRAAAWNRACDTIVADGVLERGETGDTNGS